MAAEIRERNPYVGPRAFGSRERQFFFGRDLEIGEVASLVITNSVVLLYGQTGSGKTSFLKAGLIPLLESEEGFEVLPLTRVGGRIPDTLQPEEVANPYVLSALLRWAGDAADARQLAGLSLADYLEQREHLTDDMGLSAPRAVVFDQFEELCTAYPERWGDRDDFFQQVGQAVEQDPLLRVVLVMREDYVAQLDPYVPLLPGRLRRYRLERLRAGAALAAVTGPLAGSGCSYAEGVAEALIDDLRTVQVQTAEGETVVTAGEFVEPAQLQVACWSLWEGLPAGTDVITQEHLQAFGDPDHVLSGFYERSVEVAAELADTKEGALRDWFEKRLITPEGTRGTVYRGPQETGGIPNKVVDVLENSHLIRGERWSGARWYELTHDRFIEPIRTSNARWREERRRRRLTGWLPVAGLVILILVLLIVGTLARLSIELERANQLRRGLDYAVHGESRNAVGVFDEIIEFDTDDATAYYYRGFVYADMGDEEQAIADYTEAIRRDDGNARAYFRRGTVYRTLGESDKAIDDFGRAIQRDRDYEAAYWNRALVYVQLGDDGQAIADYSQVIALDPAYAKAYNNRGNAYRRQGKYDKAITDLSKAIELDPSEAKPYNNRGLVSMARGNYEWAISDYNQAIELDPKYAQAYNNRGNAYREQGNLDLALDDYYLAIRLDGDYALAYANRGWVHSRMGSHTQAFQDFDRALELDPDNRWAYYYRGLIYAELEEEEKAIADLETYLQSAELPADSSAVERAQETLERLRGQ